MSKIVADGAKNEKVKAPKKKAVSRKDMSKIRWTLKEMRVNWLAYAFIAPYYIIFLTFTIIPVFVSFFLSFTSFNMIDR